MTEANKPLTPSSSLSSFDHSGRHRSCAVATEPEPNRCSVCVCGKDSQPHSIDGLTRMLPRNRLAETQRGIMSVKRNSLMGSEQDTSDSSESDLEYGPGIVEKLKTKFHRLAGVGRSTSRVLKQTHSSSVFNNNYGDDEPEFLRVARSLRRKAGYAEDVQSDCECKLIDEGVGKQSGWHSLKSYQKVVFPMRSTEIPTLSKNARVEEDDFYVENTSSTTTSSTRAAQIIPSSTEPPIPPRQSFSSSYVTESSAFAPSRAVICDPSPSEERKTSQDTFSSEHRGSTHERFEASSLPKISPRTAESKFSQPSTVSNLFSPQIILRNNDASGMVEMQKLLDKFQRTRAERQLNMAEYPSPTQSLSSSTITVTNRQQSRSHTVVSVRSSDLSTSSPSSQIHYLEKDSSPGIVSISVKEDENMFSHGRRIHNTSMSSSTEPPPVVKHPIHSPLLWKSSRLEQLDNDLPSNYEEWKKEDEKKMHSEAQHATESHTLSKVSQAASVCKESDDVQNLYYTDFENNIVAGDGNLVSHTLLNLAMEEDIPALMEAMHETYSFEFEDLKDETPSSSSILHTPETRKARRKARQVYTYLDEVSAIVKREWVDGVHVDYETYQSVNSTNQDDCNTTDIRDCKKDLYSLYIEEQANDDDAPFDMSVSPKIAQWQSRIQNSTRCA
ncbi:hypothetical protein Q1695_000401 [Nippostrongylus brasiliensis]|nr:hypothetical protein Q1695_000401 [Nippostrongylus brasiliensis]